jgi:hypothetical protein
MTRFSRARKAVCLPLLGLALLIPALTITPATSSNASSASSASSASRAAGNHGSLRIVNKAYVGGQAITFAGRLGVRGVRRIHLQTNMPNQGSSWNDLEGNKRWLTNRDGSFRFRTRALSMFNIRVRVKARGHATRAVNMVARSQDLTIQAPNHVDVGQTFTLRVDTTPTLRNRPDLVGLPVFKGRVLTLQQRTSRGGWRTLDTSRVGDHGGGSFRVRPGVSGTKFYRVRQENWTKRGSWVGWLPSFPLAVRVGYAGSSEAPRAQTAPARSSADLGGATTARSGSGGTAAQRYNWAPSRWDFAWEFGESLTSRPYRGTDRPLRGWWQDRSYGSGRVAKHNGGMVLDSQRQRGGPGDFGTTTSTLQRNSMTYGRWEMRMRLKQFENNAANYRAIIELIPARKRDYHCGAQNITVAEIRATRPEIRIGAKALRRNREWSATRSFPNQDLQHAVAVEVARGHVSWFVDGRVIGTVRSRAAVPDVPLTLRLRLVGEGNREMNTINFISDWQRGFSLGRGRRVSSGAALNGGTHGGGC